MLCPHVECTHFRGAKGHKVSSPGREPSGEPSPTPDGVRRSASRHNTPGAQPPDRHGGVFAVTISILSTLRCWLALKTIVRHGIAGCFVPAEDAVCSSTGSAGED